MNELAALILIFSLLSLQVYAQESDFWGADTSEQIRIYAISFSTSDNGWAESFFGDVLKTTDGGQTW
ncbi:MAG: hypothetical protein OEM46_08410 [Ignavibacteria bacterium]|nr:hypothetical protein [Ignavibacteria bacterium]